MRFRTIRHDQQRADEVAALKKERQEWRNQAAKMGPEVQAGEWLPEDPEVASVEALVTHLIEEGRVAFTAEELGHVAFNERRTTHAVRVDLEGYGLKLAPRTKPSTARGFRANSHNLYAGNPCAGGGGGNAIIGLAD